MTLPNEELRALKQTREFLRELASGPRMPMKDLRERARACLHHYPFDMHLEERYSNDVCEHGDMGEWCLECVEYRFNNGRGAVLCRKCYAIIDSGLSYDEAKAKWSGTRQVCEGCKQ